MDKGFIFALLFAVLIGVFALANSERVVVDFIFTHIEISQALVILLSALLGALIVFFIGLIRNIKMRQNIKKLQGKIEDLEREQNSLVKIIDENKELEETAEDTLVKKEDTKKGLVED